MRRYQIIFLFIVACRAAQQVKEVFLTDGFAYHKELFPFSPEDWLGFALAAVGLLIAAGGGIGGGGILVPVYMLILKFKPKHAIPLSNVTILGGAIANTILNCKRRHPTRSRPVIDWDMILMMEPSTIAGAVFGSFLNKMLPNVFITVSLVIVLGVMGRRTLKKGIRMFQTESLRLNTYEDSLAQLNEDRLEGVEMQVQNAVTPDFVSLESGSSSDDGDSPGTPWRKVWYLAACFLGTIVLTILKGSGHFDPLGIECGSLTFWLMSFASIPWVLAFAYLFRRTLVMTHEQRELDGYEYDQADIKWDRWNTIRYPLICTLAGLCAGLFGVGGGIVKGPLMLEMGVLPAVASATAATMILFTTAAASVSFFIFGLLDIRYAGFMFVGGFVCTFLGQVGLNKLMGHANRQSPIVLCIGTVILLSSVLVMTDTIVQNAHLSIAELFRIRGVCSVSSLSS